MTHSQMLTLAERIKKSTLPNTISPDMVGSLFTALVGSGVTDTPVLQLKLRKTVRYPEQKTMLFVRFTNRFRDSPEMAGYSFYVVYWHRQRKKWSHRLAREKRSKFGIKITDCYTEENDPNGWMLLPFTAQSLGNSLIPTKSKKSFELGLRYVVINCGIVAMRNNAFTDDGTFKDTIQESLVARFKIRVSSANKICSYSLVN